MSLNKNFLSLVLLIFIGCSVLSAQTTISGKVYDIDNNTTLPGASIAINNMSVGVTTDNNGYFELKTTQSLPITLIVSYVGYGTEQVIINNSGNIDLFLKTRAFLGSTVVVSASRKTEKISEAPASISVIEARRMNGVALSHPGQHLRNTPGVDFSQQGTDHFQISLRGRNDAFTTDSYFLLDYRSLITPGLGLAILASSPLNDLDLDRIEVVRGPGSALYGPGVETGVIHFISKNAFDHPGTSVSLTGGTRSSLGISARQAGTISDKFGYKFLAYYNKSNDFSLDPDDPIDAESLGNFIPTITSAVTGEALFENVDEIEDKVFNYGMTGTFEYKFSDKTSIISTSGYSFRKGILRASLGEALQNYPTYFTQLRFKSGNFFAQGFMNILDNTKENSYLYRTGLTSINKNTGYQFQSQYFFNAFDDKLGVTVGAESQLTISKTEGTTHGRYENEDDFNIYSAYTQGEYAVNDKIELLVAARLDNFSALGTTSISPRAAIVYKHNETQSFRATYNHAVSSPQALFLFADIPFGVTPAFDIPLIGGLEDLTFSDPLITQSFIPGVGSYPGINMPLAIPYGIALAGLEGSFSADVIGYVASKLPDVTSTTGGVMLLNGRAASTLPQRGKIKPPKTSSYEIGYKGVFGNKLAVTVDLYYNKRKDLVFTSQASPLILYPALAPELVAEFNRVTDPDELLALGITQEILGSVFEAVGNSLAENPLGLVEPTVAADLGRPQFVFTFFNAGEIDYYGGDLSLTYYFNEELSAFGNYSWLSKNFWNDEEIGQAGTGQQYGLNISKTKIRFGLDYIPEQKGIGYSASVRYQSGLDVENGMIFSGHLDAYAIFDAGISYRLNNGIQINLTGQNLLDENYRAMPRMPKMGRLVLAKLVFNL